MNTVAVCSDFPELDQEIYSSSYEVMQSREERVHMYIRSLPKTARVLLGTREDTLSDDGPFSKELLEIGSYRLNMIEFFGLDFVGPLPEDVEGLIFPIYDSSKGNGSPEFVQELTDCSVWAIDVYNKINGTEFGNVQVLKANAHPRTLYAYFITFKSTNQKGQTETFQGVVSTERNVPGKLVEFVRIKPPFKPYPHTTTTLGQELKKFAYVRDEALKNY